MKLRNNMLLAGVFALITMLAVSQNVNAQDPAPQQPAGDDVISVVNASDEHTIFAELIEEAQLTETLSQQGPFTILAPTDAAFEPMDAELEALRQNPQDLQNVMINHLFQGEASANEVEENFGIPVENGDIEASNGVIHSIEEVLLER